MANSVQKASRIYRIGPETPAGVTFDKRSGKWLARVYGVSPPVFVGYFENDKEAATVQERVKKVLKKRGVMAALDEVDRARAKAKKEVHTGERRLTGKPCTGETPLNLR